VELDLADGTTLALDIDDVTGSPARPLSPAAARAKFDSCCRSASTAAALWSAALALETLDDVAAVTRFTTPAH